MTKNQKPICRSVMLHLPIPLADALEYARYVRQKHEGRPIPKKQLIREALEQYLQSVAH